MRLPRPEHINITRDYEEEKVLLEKSRAYLERDKRTGIHASDLLDPRLAYFKRKNPEVLPDRLVNMFLVGQIAHVIIEAVMGGTGVDDYKKSDAGTRLFEGLQYSPDFLEKNGVVTEVKTTRSFYLPKQAYLPDDSVYRMYIEQLMIYMAAENKPEGRLTVLYLNHKIDQKTTPSFFVWKISTTPVVLEALRGVIRHDVAQLEIAITNNDPSILPLCRVFKCGDNCEFFTKELCNPQGRMEFGGSDKAKKEWTA